MSRRQTLAGHGVDVGQGCFARQQQKQQQLALPTGGTKRNAGGAVMANPTRSLAQLGEELVIRAIERKKKTRGVRGGRREKRKKEKEMIAGAPGALPRESMTRRWGAPAR